MLFRFYDPVVLARILSEPGLDATRFFGPVQTWFVEAHDSHDGAGPGTGASRGEDAVGVAAGDDSAGQDALAVDGDAWLAPPVADVDAHLPPTALLEFRARRMMVPIGAVVPVRVMVTRRVHDLLPGTMPA